MGQWKHRLESIDLLSMEADCANCGRIKIIIKDNRPKCSVARKNQNGPVWKNRKSPMGKCPICLETKKLCRDHNHSCCADQFSKSCGQCFRGLICSNCNHGLGNFKDNIESLKRAIQYLNKSLLE